ncbi:hypothetical protein EON63_12465 [archaeon]|nr:MAG: hypothetical protein EON63_12465 [archaeon]
MYICNVYGYENVYGYVCVTWICVCMVVCISIIHIAYMACLCLLMYILSRYVYHSCHDILRRGDCNLGDEL